MFYDKLNYKEDGFYSVVDQVELVNGEYKGVLNHDHVDRGTILIIDEEGNEIKDYFISDNPEKPWETEIELFGSKGVKTAYIHYNTKGDIVDADDINKIQDAISEDDGALDKVKEDIIVLKETKSDKRYVDRELEKKVDTSEFSDTVDKLADKEETQRQLNNKIEWVNNMSGKRVTLYGNMIDTEWGSGKTITDELNKKADKTYVDDELKKKADFDYVLSLDFDIGDLQDEKADKDYVEEKISNINIDQFKAIDKGGYSFDNLKEPGVFRLWNRNTSPCGGTSDYIVVVYKYSNKIIQVAHSSTTSSDIENRAYTRYYTGTRWTSWRELTDVGIKQEIDKKADKSDLDNLDLAGRTSTIVIANYDSHEKSKKGADIVINKGENASKKINDAIQSLKGTGGEVKLMEGNYNLEYGIAVNVNNVHLTGVPNATILVQNKNWKDNPYNGGRKHIVDTMADIDNLEVIISNLHVKGAKIPNSRGVNCTHKSKVINCISEDSGLHGFFGTHSSIIESCISRSSLYVNFYCRDLSTINNCISEDSGGEGFFCWDFSTVNNCISENNFQRGFYCQDSSIVRNCTSKGNNSDGIHCKDNCQIINCISEDNERHGFFIKDNSAVTNCTSQNNGSNGVLIYPDFKGICSFNTLKNNSLGDNSSATAIVEYNIVQEG